MKTDSSTTTFEQIDWNHVQAGRIRLGAQTKVFLVAIGIVAALFLYDHLLMPLDDINIGRWELGLLDWLFIPSLLALIIFVCWPLARNRDRTTRYWRELRKSRIATVSFGYLVLFVVVGTIGPLLFGRIEYNLLHAYQPPLFTSVEYGVMLECAGEVVGGVNGQCHGSLTYPLGTNRDGKGLLELSISGMRVALLVAMITSAIIIPLATAVGTVAGYVGGWVDEVLMRYVDVQQSIPAFIVYLMVIFLHGRSLFLFILVFGLFNWGGVARLVRSEVLQQRESEFVIAAKNAGAGPLFIIRRHILPNISGTVITATTRKIPLLILAEAAISFLNLNDIMLMSWGEAIAIGLQGTYFPEIVWWPPIISVLFLGTTIYAFSVFGDALRDIFDPRVTP